MSAWSRITVPTVLLAAVATMPRAAEAQEYTHPREMDLPTPAFERPDPTSLRLRLDNGLVAYVAEDHRAPLVTLTAFVAAGTADGDPGAGAVVAAALRRGPASMAAGEFRAALKEMAADYSVAMSHEETEVRLDVPAEDAWRALDLFQATLTAPRFESSGASGAGRAAAQVGGIDFDSSIEGARAAFRAHLFDGHRYGQVPTAAESVAAREGGAAAFHMRFFVPSNVTMAVSGDFGADEAREQVRSAFASWPAGDRPELVEHRSVSTSAPRQILQAEADKLQGWVVMGHEISEVPDDERAAVEVMTYILGAYHLDTRLFRASRSQRGLTNDNSAFLEPSVRGPGTYTVQTYGRPEVVQLLVELSFQELSRIRDEPVTAEELFVAKGALVDGTHATRYTTGQDAARSYAREWLHYDSHDRSERFPDAVRAVSIEDVQDAARSYLHPERMVIAVVGPLEKITAAPSLEGEPPLASWGEVVRVDGGGGR